MSRPSTVTCDRCGVSGDEKYFVTLHCLTHVISPGDIKSRCDLCAGCALTFQNWMKGSVTL